MNYFLITNEFLNLKFKFYLFRFFFVKNVFLVVKIGKLQNLPFLAVQTYQ